MRVPTLLALSLATSVTIAAPPGAQDASLSAATSAPFITVSDAAAASRALARASAGQVIVLAPGTYRFGGPDPGIDPARVPNVTLRASAPGTVFLELKLREGFLISAPGWTFENLHIRGACPTHADCEHAFHIVGKASRFTARNNTIIDFNAHFKINGSGGDFPDGGLIEHNTLRNTSARQTDGAVTLIDLVAASGWVIRANKIADFVKDGGDRTSYGAFAKGAGSANRFERNLVLCESALRGAPGTRVGLSLGGGGTGAPYCRDKLCVNEQSGGVIVANLIASCSDEGIYLNRASASQVLHNTLLGTAGIMARFEQTSADVEGNLFDGRIASGKGAVLRARDNRENSGALAPAAGAFAWRWRGPVPRRAAAVPAPPDLCAATRPAAPAYGAFEDLGACGKLD